MAEFEIRPLGDCGIIVGFGRQDAAVSAALIDELLDARCLLQQAEIRGVTEITTAFASVALFYDPARVGERGESMFASLEAEVRAALENRTAGAAATVAEHDVTEVPVCYDQEFALDVIDVARHAGLSPENVVKLHASAEYRVGCIGFTPAFPYLVGLPAELATPRRATPRTAVPAGSVAIGGSQTGIYPVQSPGGWNVIGRTPLRLFDPVRETPSLLRAGDAVRLRGISREEFDARAAEAGAASVQASANK